ncbi:DSPc-domain-containing protein [Rozella allomycis CSF55]|uniref:protein-tyrosine-phosphatase n=1 Tax=Rozella allomycis (strain CSF55) TaxID=988480 RepID=A0A4P9YMF5_ROZAC|nr:DSPc-domain-containing protein [Rozella allomycis CSF55]
MVPRKSVNLKLDINLSTFPAFTTRIPSTYSAIKTSLFEILPCVYLGNSFVASKGSILKQLDITNIINVANEIPCFFLNDHISHFDYLHLPWDHASKIQNDINDINRFIDKAISEKGNILIHCDLGKSRSACAMIGFIMHNRALPFDEAYKLVKEKAPHISPNFELLYQLIDFETNQ